VTETGELNILSASYDALSQAYALNGNYKEALESKNKYLIIKDSVHSVKNALKIANLEHERETEKKNEEVRYTMLMNKVSVGAVILLSFIVVLVYRSFKTVKKTNTLVAKLVDEQESTIEKRTQELAESNKQIAHANKKLLDLIQYNAHNVREPLTRLLGAMIVKEYISEREFHDEIWPLMEKAANDLDNSIKDVISIAEETVGSYAEE
jgi:C4-dicarboxylate-specific signal transduction histidine kinase